MLRSNSINCNYSCNYGISIYLFSRYVCFLYIFIDSLCALRVDRGYRDPTPTRGIGVGVAEKWVGVKRQPIGLYTHPHSLPFDTQGVAENGYPMENRYHVLKTKRKAVNLDGEESNSKKRNL